MHRYLVCFLWFASGIYVWAQDLVLPSDLRQHNLSQFNASLLNPTFASDWNQPDALSVWTRWQWQGIDVDPTTIFANYTHQFNEKSTMGIGFLQNNAGIYLTVGGNANYAHTFWLNEKIRFMAGLNVFAFQRTVADDVFIQNSGLTEEELADLENFRLQFSPGFRLMIDRFGVGVAFENVYDLNLSGSDSEDSEYFKTIIGTLSYDFPIQLFSATGESFVRPVAYIKTLPYADTQYGFNGLFSAPWFWVQGGYNSFYGPSGGLGITIANSFSIGGLMEFGTDNPISEEDPTLELIASYHFGKSKNPETEMEPVEEFVDEEALERERLALLQQEKDSLDQVRRMELIQKEKDSLEQVRQRALQMEEQRRKDSLELARQQRLMDSIARVQSQKVEVKPNEKYEEVENEDGLEPGFYLIANVFGTQKYFENFLQTLKDKGLEPKSFHRKLNGYNYVYLERYNSMDEARKARDSKFYGRYEGKTWIFRVIRN